MFIFQYLFKCSIFAKRELSILALLLLFTGCSFSSHSTNSNITDIRAQVGQMILVGFRGTSPEDSGVKEIYSQLESGAISGVIFYKYNIIDKEQFQKLVNHLLSAKTNHPVIIAIDQEGGKVQRLNETNGFERYFSAKEVARNLTPDEAKEYYKKLACELKELGVNFNFAPVVDVDVNPDSPAIGALERSFSSDPNIVVAYAKEHLQAHKECGVLTSLKHFPGHGSADGDTHKGFVDVSKTWQELELAPYEALIENHAVPSIMSAHVVNQKVSNLPASLSKEHINRVRDMGFDGVVVSDDLQMGAITLEFEPLDAAIKAIEAGSDLLIISNYFDPRSDWPERIAKKIEESIDEGRISKEAIDRSCKRVVDMKSLIDR